MSNLLILNFYEFVTLLVAIIFGRWGFKLIGTATQSPDLPSVIPDKDRDLLAPLITEKEGIERYVVLSSLSGFTGTFQKIGFSGLPLATVILTLIFCALHFAARDTGGDSAFLELAKLTTGAFIGSFVQKTQPIRETDAKHDIETILRKR